MHDQIMLYQTLCNIFNPLELNEGVTLRYCFFTSSGDESKGSLRYSNAFNLKHERILQNFFPEKQQDILEYSERKII